MNYNGKHFELNDHAMTIIANNIEKYFDTGSRCNCHPWVGETGVISQLPQIRDEIFSIRSSIKCNASAEVPTHQLHVDVDVLGRYGDAFETDYGFFLRTSDRKEKCNLKTWIINSIKA